MTKRRVATFLFIIGLILALDAFWIGPDSLIVNRQRLAIPHWARELRIAAISDLHVGSPFVGLAKLRKVVERTNAEHPDLILLLGDYVIGGADHSAGVPGGEFVDPEPIAAELKALQAPLGVFAVLGNHDIWFDGARVTHALTTAGITVLENQTVRIDNHGAPFWLGGVADRWVGGPDIPHTVEQAKGSEPVLLFTHNPDLFPQIPDRVSLTLAGHTHGGQVDFPIVGRLIVPANNRYSAGHVVEQGRHLFVTSGVGTSMLPVRFRVPPEIALLTLVAQ